MKLRSEETTPVSFKHVFDVLNDFSYKRQACVFSRTGTASLPAYRKVQASGADSPGLGSQARLQRKRQRLRCSKCFHFSANPLASVFPRGIPKGTRSDIPTQSFAQQQPTSLQTTPRKGSVWLLEKHLLGRWGRVL